VFGVSEAKNPS